MDRILAAPGFRYITTQVSGKLSVKVPAIRQLLEMSDLRKVEEELRTELSSALARLNRARAGIESLSGERQIPIGTFRAAVSERLEALRNLEAASMRFAKFVLDGVIPPDTTA
jgi:hypothetical protein